MRVARVTLTSTAATVLVLAMLVVAPAPASADPVGEVARELRADNPVDPAIQTQDGLLRTVSAQPGHPLGSPTAAPAETVARDFLDNYGVGFGLSAGDEGLVTAGVDTARDGDRIVRFQQQVGGVPVLGGDVVVSTDDDGRVLTASGEVTPYIDDPDAPRVVPSRAIRVAVEAAAKAENLSSDELLGAATRWLYDPQLIGGPGTGARQVWRVEVRTRATGDPLRAVLVDATLGTVVLDLDLRAHAKQRLVCDYTNVGQQLDPSCEGDSTKLVRTEGQAESSVADVNKAYEYTGATYDFYARNFGRNSIDDAGMPLRSSVRVCFSGGACPYQNAYWDGQKMVFGSGFASADDVVGHELTHGVTEHTSGLFYAYQSGAINESLSDTMGEFIDQTYAAGTTDGPQYDWLIGEDLPASIGVIRNMADPGQFGDPDRMTSPNYVGETHYGDAANPDDSGGVHTNNGVGNKAAYLMTAPGTRTFNGVTVSGIGVTKAAQVYYRTMSLLTSGSDYADLAAALDSACASLVTGAVAGITAADCTQVGAATAAVEMTAEPVTASAQAPDVARCPDGGAPTLDRTDGFENGLGAWTTTGDYGDGFSYVTGYAHTGTHAMYAQTGDSDAAPKQTAAWTALALPPGRASYVWFAHSYDFDTRGTANHDGGRVEYRVGGGAWTDAAALLTGGYTGSLSGAAGTGAAFVGDSHGYRSTRVDLSSFAGSSVQIRFVTLADVDTGSFWLIDDVQAYGCTPVAPPVVTPPVEPPADPGTEPAAPPVAVGVAGLSAVGGTPGNLTLSWATLAGATGYDVDVVGAAVAGLPATVGATQKTITGLTSTAGYTFTVTPRVAGGVPSSVVVKASAVSLQTSAPTVVSPGAATLSGVVSTVGGGAPSGTVQLLARRKGTAAWAQAATAAVGSSGAFSFSQAPAYGTEYRAEATGGTRLLSSASRTVSVALAPVVTLLTSVSTAKAGATVWFTGTTKPAHAYAATAIQYYYAGAWRTIATTRTYSGGNFSVAAKPVTRGTWAYRAAITGDSGFAFAASRNVAVKTS